MQEVNIKTNMKSFKNLDVMDKKSWVMAIDKVVRLKDGLDKNKHLFIMESFLGSIYDVIFNQQQTPPFELVNDINNLKDNIYTLREEYAAMDTREFIMSLFNIQKVCAEFLNTFSHEMVEITMDAFLSVSRNNFILSKGNFLVCDKDLRNPNKTATELLGKTVHVIQINKSGLALVSMVGDNNPKATYNLPIRALQ